MAVAVIYFWGCWAIGAFPYYLWTFNWKVRNPETWQERISEKWVTCEAQMSVSSLACQLSPAPGSCQALSVCRALNQPPAAQSAARHKKELVLLEVAVQLSRAGMRLLELLKQKGIIENQILINRTLLWWLSLQVCAVWGWDSDNLPEDTSLEVNFCRECLPQVFVACL